MISYNFALLYMDNFWEFWVILGQIAPNTLIALIAPIALIALIASNAPIAPIAAIAPIAPILGYLGFFVLFWRVLRGLGAF